jgi:cell division protease FtsH
MKIKFFRIILLIILGVFLYQFFGGLEKSQTQYKDIPYSEFIVLVRQGEIKKVLIQGNLIKGLQQNGIEFFSHNPGDPRLIDDLLEFQVKIESQQPEQPSMFMQILISWFPMLLLIAVWIYFYKRQQTNGGGMGGNNQMGFGKSKAKLLAEDQIAVRFTDVAGVEEAKQDVVELVDFLRDPERYEKVGGVIPRGILMVGPPGTGKTLLARAIAGEAAVPFFSTSGSDFVEMYVGVGASRVRDMFTQAKEKAPCIIFIDEIDAVGRQRGGGANGGNDEREQTLNQLLVEMDGFAGNEGVIVIAATNRSDVLDKALLRPGRFDRQVTVNLPDIKGREQILDVHIQKVPAADDVNLVDLARGTPGFSGAELANLINEGALSAARNRTEKVTMQQLDDARDKMIMGAEKRSMIMRDEDRLMTAYHEAGHAIVGRLLPIHDPVYKVSIMPRGQALGITMFLPEHDQYSASKAKLESQIASLYGGRLAEEIIFGKDKVTTGASNDIERATEIARNMVTKWGLSETMGPLSYSDQQGQQFMGYPGAQASSNSAEIAYKIDKEIRHLIDENYQKAELMLLTHIEILHNMAEALMLWETIDKFQIDVLMQGKKLDAPKQQELNQVVTVTETDSVSHDNSKKERGDVGLPGLAT